ncbi:MAG: sulfur carrier protein ThiS [Armatimonadetes bacterium]|nr:sulfur carrier protein ThiS [Armatimonadota bacterium]
MRVCVNGKEIEVAESLTVAALVAEKGLNPDTVVVEHNLVILPKEEWSRSVLAAEDKIEIVSFVGGG